MIFSSPEVNIYCAKFDEIRPGAPRDPKIQRYRRRRDPNKDVNRASACGFGAPGLRIPHR
jgi:hypothetical protein